MDPDQVSKLAVNYRQLILWFAAHLIISMASTIRGGQAGDQPLPFLSLVFGIELLVTVVALAVYAYRMAKALGSSAAPLWAIAMLTPGVNLLTFAVLDSKARAVCRAHGISIGFLGPQV